MLEKPELVNWLWYGEHVRLKIYYYNYTNICRRCSQQASPNFRKLFSNLLILNYCKIFKMLGKQSNISLVAKTGTCKLVMLNTKAKDILT